KAYQKIQDLNDPYWKDLKTQQIKEIIAASAGLYLEVSTEEEYATPGQDLEVEIEATNRSNVEIDLKSVNFSSAEVADFQNNIKLKKDQDFKESTALSISKNTKYSNPYWLDRPHELGMYIVEDQELLGL